MIKLGTIGRLPSAPPDFTVWALTLLALVPLCWLLFHGLFSILAFAVIALALVVATRMDRPFSIVLIFAFLYVLGDIRRLIGSAIGFPKLDPLLLVGPVITIILVLPLLVKIRVKDSISKAMLGLMAIMMFEIVNPRQGSIVVGLSGAMFYLIPVLWFWIGRQYGTYALLSSVIYKVIIPLSVLAALLGLWQTYVGFFPWETAWIDAVASHYHSLNLGAGFIRSFGFSVNGVEYACLLLVGASCALAAFLAGRRAYGFLLPLLGTSLFLASSRTAIVKLLFAIAVAWALNSRSGRGWAVRLPFGLAVLFGVLAFTLSQFSSVAGGRATAVSTSAEHQLQGLSHPLDSKKSTAGLHTTMFLSGFKEGFHYPIGSGLGSVTLGSSRLGGSDVEFSGSTEVDISDAFVSMGLVGGTLYLAIVFLTVRRSIEFGRIAPKYLGLPVIALLAALVGNWIALGQYANGPVIWFIIGALVRNSILEKEASKRRREEYAVA